MENQIDYQGRVENASKTKKKLIVLIERLVIKKTSQCTPIKDRENKMRQEKKKSYSCLICGGNFSSNEVLKNHIIAIHEKNISEEIRDLTAYYITVKFT